MIFWEYFFPGLLVTRWFKYVTGNRNIASNIQSSSILFIKNRWSEGSKPEISVLGQHRRQMLKKDLPSPSDPLRNFQSEKRLKLVKFVQYHRGSGFYWYSANINKKEIERKWTFTGRIFYLYTTTMYVM